MSSLLLQRAGRRSRTVSAAVLVVTLGLALSVLPSVANASLDVPGGTTAETAVPLPVVDLNSSFIATNVGSSSAGTSESQPVWNNTTWYSYTPVSTVTVHLRATSVSPAGWDNTLEVWTAAGALVDQNADSDNLDAALVVTLQAGVDYRIALGGYHSGSRGSATLIFSYRVPSAPSEVAGTAGDARADVSWTAPVDLAGGVTSYDVYCTPAGGEQSLCATEHGTPPSTSTTVTGLVNGTTYAVSVTATNSIGASEQSAPASVLPTGPSTVSISTDPVSPESGAPFEVVVLVTSHDAPVPGGTLDITVAGTRHLGLALVAGQATVAGVTSLVGDVVIDAAYSGAVGITSSSDQATVSVVKRNQTVDPTVLPADLTLASDPIPWVATASSGLPVTLAATGACGLTDAVLHLVGVGSCTVTATQAGDAQTNAAESTQSVQIAKRPQSVTLDLLPALVYGQTTTLVAASSLERPVTLSATGACTVADGVLTASGVGLCTVTASQAGDDLNAAVADVVRTVEVGKRPQTITIVPLVPLIFGLAPVVVHASSDLGFDVTVVASGACAITDGELTTIGSGTCTLVASALGDDVSEAGSASMSLEVAGVPTSLTAQIAADLGAASPRVFTTATAAPASGEPVAAEPVAAELSQTETEPTDPALLGLLWLGLGAALVLRSRLG